jgi:serine/threonine-protein kinase
MGGSAPATPLAMGAAPSLAGRTLGRYQVLCQLAAGGMAGVYVARALAVAGFERLVAVKVLHPHLAHEDEFISMFLDEARLAARIRHPNVVPTLDISDTEGDGFFLVMEYVEGHHLGALLQQAAKEGARVPPPVIARVVLDALAGLSAAHTLVDERGMPLHLVHRDVSPHNILVGVDGVSRLTDFGVAKAEVRLTSTREGQFKGKLAYMAPEHASTGQADQRSDLFAMGVILWEGLTGRRLFRADTNAQILQKILVDEIPPPSSVRDDLAVFDALCAKAMAREPDDRFQSADEFAAALEDVAAVAGGVATPRQVGEVVRRLAAEKLARERARIQEALAGCGAGGGAAMPVPRSASEPSTPSMPSRSRSAPAGSWQGTATQTSTGAGFPERLRPYPPSGPHAPGLVFEAGREPADSRALGEPSPFDAPPAPGGTVAHGVLAGPASTSAAPRRDGDGRRRLRVLAAIGVLFLLLGAGGTAAVAFGVGSRDATSVSTQVAEGAAERAPGPSTPGEGATRAARSGDQSANPGVPTASSDSAGAPQQRGIGARGAGGGGEVTSGSNARSEDGSGRAENGRATVQDATGHGEMAHVNGTRDDATRNDVGASSRGGSRRRRGHDAAATQVTTSAGGGGTSPVGVSDSGRVGSGTGGGGGAVTRRANDDDLLLSNPYRR